MSGAADLRSTLRLQGNNKNVPSTATYSASQGTPGPEESTQSRETKLIQMLIEGCNTTTGLFLLTLQAHATFALKNKNKRESNCLYIDF